MRRSQAEPAAADDNRHVSGERTRLKYVDPEVNVAIPSPTGDQPARTSATIPLHLEAMTGSTVKIRGLSYQATRYAGLPAAP